MLMRMMLIRMMKTATKLGQADGRVGPTTAALRSHVQRRPQLQLQLLMMMVVMLLLMMMLVLLMVRVYLLMRLLLVLQLQLLLLTLQLRRDLALLAGKRLYRIRLLLRVVREK